MRWWLLYRYAHMPRDRWFVKSSDDINQLIDLRDTMVGIESVLLQADCHEDARVELSRLICQPVTLVERY